MQPQRGNFSFTSSPATVTLFSQYDDLNRQPMAILVSAITHTVLIGLVFFGIVTAPKQNRVITERYTVRHLDLTDPILPQPAPSKQSAAAKEVAKALADGRAPAPAALQQAIHAATGPQTLLQPDLAKKLAAAEAVPVPRVMIWTPSQTQVKTIVAPQPTPPTTATTKPSLDAPNAEINMAEVNVAASKLPSQKLALMPSSTTPVLAQNKSQIELAPISTTQTTLQPTPTALLSISDLQMKNGSVTLPPINETVKNSTQGKLGGSNDSKLQDANGHDAGNAKGNGAGQANAASGGKPGTTISTVPADIQQSVNGSNGAGNQVSTTQISLPRDGKFNTIVVGQQMNDQYPEVAEVWSGRMAYTVYLHVGLARSWILQYSMPPDADAAAAGNTSHLDAPWPFSIVRPNISAAEVNAEALMIHGFVNESGHFENLSMVFPQKCAQAPFVLKSLEQWQFRPAAQNGKVAKVEVLLIIPEDLD